MAKRELSSTLRNLKFMQRAARKEEAAKKEEEKPIPSTTQNRNCIVIMEGDPHPDAPKGRMSFQSFNPFVDKLNEEAERHSQSQHHDASKAELSTDRGNGGPESESHLNVARTDSESDDEHKTKKPKLEMDMVNESQFTINAGHSKPSNKGAGTSKQQSQGRLDWRVLRPPTGQNKQRS